MHTLDEVRAAAMRLPLEDRAELVEEIVSSLPMPPAVDEYEFGQTILRRAAAYDRGETVALDREETIELMRTTLERRIRDAAQG